MWKPLMLAVGTFIVLVGLQSLAVEKVTFQVHEAPVPSSENPNQFVPGPPMSYQPPRWFPWVAMVLGVTVCIYTHTLPKRFGKG